MTFDNRSRTHTDNSQAELDLVDSGRPHHCCHTVDCQQQSLHHTTNPQDASNNNNNKNPDASNASPTPCRTTTPISSLHCDNDNEEEDDSMIIPLSLSPADVFTLSSPPSPCRGQPNLYGRDAEKEQLKASWMRCCQAQQRELVVIAGAPGTGKSELACTLRPIVARGTRAATTTTNGDCGGTPPRTGLFASAKFPEFSYHAKVPFEVFVHATSHLVRQIVCGHDQVLLAQCQKKLSNFVSAQDLEILFQMIPDLQLLMQDEEEENEHNNHMRNDNNKKSKSHPKMWRRGGPTNKTATATTTTMNKLLTVPIKPKNRKDSQTIGRAAFLQHQEISTRLYGCETENRLKAAYAATLAAICSVTPVLLLLDDIQWADTASLAMLQNLFRYPQNTFPLMIVATYRTEGCCPPRFLVRNVAAGAGPKTTTGGILDARRDDRTKTSRNEQHRSPLEKLLESIRRDGHANVSTLALDNIHLDDLTKLLVDRLQLRHLPLQDVRAFAQVVYQQTQGNVFHIFQLLRFLAETNLITKNKCCDSDDATSYGTGWSWDLKRLEQELSPSASSSSSPTAPSPKYSVFDLVRFTFQSLPEEIVETLKVASCMGVDVDVSALDLVAGNGNAAHHCKYAADVGLLVFSPQYGGYRFVHDHIRHVANSLIPEKESQQFYLNIGKRLWKQSNPVALESNIMMVVSLLNMGADLVVEQSERYQLAELNLRAALKAYQLPSFADSGVFLVKGIGLLDEKSWESQYRLTLHLYSYAAEVETLNANYKVGLSYVHEVLKRGASLDDKLKAYTALPRTLELQGDWKGAIEVCAHIVRELGVKVPKKQPSWIGIAKELLRIRRMLKGRSQDSIMALPTIESKRIKTAMQFLTAGMVVAFRYKSAASIVFVSRVMSLTFQYGQHGFSAIAFAVIGCLLCGLDFDKNEGFRLGQIAIALADRQETMMFKSWVDFFVGAGIVHWTRPLEVSMEILESSHILGAEMGYCHQSLLARLVSNWTALVAGRTLPSLEVDLKETLSMAQFYDYRYPENPVSLSLQTARLYKGFVSKEHEPCSVSSINEGIQNVCTSALSFLNFSRDRAVAVVHLGFAADLALFYGDIDEAVKITKMYWNADKEGPNALLCAGTLSFTFALIGISLLRQQSARAKGFPTRKHMDIIWRRTIDCPYNYLPFKLLLEAEWTGLYGHPYRQGRARRNHVSVESLYEKSFLSAQEQNNHRIMALSCELYGNHLSDAGDSRGSQIMWEKSADIYAEWGALLKSKLLRTRAASSAYFSLRK